MLRLHNFINIFILKSAIDDPLIFPVIGWIPDATLNLVSPTTSILLSYKASMNITSSGVIPKKVTFQEGTYINSQVMKK